MNVATLFDAVREMLRRDAAELGLAWSRRPGTVVSVTGPYDPRAQVEVLLDGEIDRGAAVTATSLAGPVAAGMRVMVDELPAGTRHISGIIAGAAPSAVAATDAVSGITTEAVVLTLPQVTFLPQAAYRVRAGAAIIAAAATIAQYGLRTGSLAGAQIGLSGYTAGAGLAPAGMRWTGYVRNGGASAVTTDVVLTITATGTTTHYGTAQIPRFLEIAYAGPSAEYPHAVTLP